MVASETFVSDLLFFIKSEISSNVTDPIASTRPSNSKFVMTSYPQREAVYPLITIRVRNYTFTRAGMQTDAMDGLIDMEVRIWARNTKERDDLFVATFNHLREMQFATNGSVDVNLHDFNMPSAVEVDEEKIKSKVIEINYKFYSI